MSVTHHLYFRLSAYYFFHFGALGALTPYWGPFLAAQGLGEEMIGILFALLLGTKVIAPYAWGWLADRSGQRMGIIRAGALGAFLVFALLLADTSLALLIVVMLGFGFFWNAILPQFEATTLTHLGHADERYSFVRMWGSIGFIVAVIGIGEALETRAISELPVYVLLFLGGVVLAVALVPESGSTVPTDRQQSVRGVLLNRNVLPLFVIFFLMQTSHGPYYSFFSLFLEQHGYGPSLVGRLWAVGVIAEVGVFLLMPKLLQQFGARRLLLFSLAAATLRWLFTALFVDKLTIILFAQTLHLASFGIYHTIAVYYVHRFFTGRLQGRGQALYSSLGFGAGGAVGSLASGFIWNAFQPAAIFISAALMTAVAFLLALRRVSDVQPQDSERQSH